MYFTITLSRGFSHTDTMVNTIWRGSERRGMARGSQNKEVVVPLRSELGNWKVEENFDVSRKKKRQI